MIEDLRRDRAGRRWAPRVRTEARPMAIARAHYRLGLSHIRRLEAIAGILTQSFSPLFPGLATSAVARAVLTAGFEALDRQAAEQGRAVHALVWELMSLESEDEREAGLYR